MFTHFRDAIKIKKVAQKKSRSTKKTKKQPNRKRIGLMLLLLVPIVVGIIYFAMPTPKRVSGPQFTKEGELQFLKGESGELIQQIEIEIADTEMDRQRGLMWRRSMEEQQGMLFIMEQLKMQNFWMLNTYIALDIIFLDADLNIVTIQKNTQPQTLDPVRSFKPAKYVVEVIAGYADKHGLAIGDKITYTRLE